MLKERCLANRLAERRGDMNGREAAPSFVELPGVSAFPLRIAGFSGSPFPRSLSPSSVRETGQEMGDEASAMSRGPPSEPELQMSVGSGGGGGGTGRDDRKGIRLEGQKSGGKKS